jgi:GAF domain-containing protein
LAVFANQAAIAIKNAQLFTEVEALKNRLQAENMYLQEEIKLAHNFDEIIGRSAALTKVLHLVEQVAATDATVLILGETGTGKELVARAVHHLRARRQRPPPRRHKQLVPPPLLGGQRLRVAAQVLIKASIWGNERALIGRQGIREV